MHRLHQAPFVLLLQRGAGLLLCLQMLSIWPDFQFFYSLEAPIDLALSSLYSPAPFHVGHLQQTLVNRLEVSPASAAHAMIFCYLGLSIMLTLHIYPRLSASVLLILHLSIFAGIPLYSYGVDQISTSVLFYCILIPARQQSSGIPMKLYRLIIQIHLCIIYFFAGFGKALGQNWWNGEALWKALQLPYFNIHFLALMPQLQDFKLIFITGGWMVILIESLYPLFIWHPRIGPYWLKVTLFLHMGIALLLNLYFFSAFMILFNLVAFYRGSLLKNYPNKSLKLNLSRWRRGQDARTQKSAA